MGQLLRKCSNVPFVKPKPRCSKPFFRPNQLRCSRRGDVQIVMGMMISGSTTLAVGWVSRMFGGHIQLPFRINWTHQPEANLLPTHLHLIFLHRIFLKMLCYRPSANNKMILYTFNPIAFKEKANSPSSHATDFMRTMDLWDEIV